MFVSFVPCRFVINTKHSSSILRLHQHGTRRAHTLEMTHDLDP